MAYGLDRKHQYLLHEFLDYQYLSATELAKVVEDIFYLEDPQPEQKIKTINSVMKTMKMEIERVMNDKDGSTNYVLVNLDDSEMIQRAKFRPKGHWEFLKEILEEIIKDEDDHSITETDALNLRNNLSGDTYSKPVNLETAQQLVSEWIRTQVLEKDDEGLISLGFVGIAEFRHLLQNQIPDSFCTVCKVTCLRGKKCTSCLKVMHKTCYTRVVDGQASTQSDIKCPSCKQNLG